MRHEKSAFGAIGRQQRNRPHHRHFEESLVLRPAYFLNDKGISEIVRTSLPITFAVGLCFMSDLRSAYCAVSCLFFLGHIIVAVSGAPSALFVMPIRESDRVSVDYH